MAELVASMVVGPLLSMVKDKASNYILEQYKVMEGMEEQHKILKRKLPAILDVIADAEQQASHREGAKAWLQEVKTVAYEANDVFDEFNYEALRRAAKKKGHMRWHRSRDEEMKNIVKKLVIDQANNGDLMVFPIVGMGGLGKTALAQLIYNDLEVQKHFQLLKWVCVSDEFDVRHLANKICDTSENILEKALQILQEKLNGKRYLLVLDDVWNEDVDKWKKLKACLQHGGTGSAVLTTTRSKRIAEFMGAGKYHDITVLDRKFIKEIIEERAFSLQKEKPAKLVNLVDRIAERCVGSPLAARAVGSVLHNKASVEEWESVLQGSSICNDETGILPILKLSYDELPAVMKQCFAFCAVFPKDYEIDVGMLIHLWIANGFISEQKGVPIETVGKRIFNEMVSRSFFQDVKEDTVTEYRRMQGYCSRIICKIHDLMHDIAVSAMETECVALTEEPNPSSESLPNTARHLYFSSTYQMPIILYHYMKKTPLAIQTMLLEDEYRMIELSHLSIFNSLRALKFPASCLSIRPKHLQHLRYLDLQGSYIKALPEDISILYNLQVLNLSGCFKLKRLPKQMKYMASLRHLYTHGCDTLEYMPPDLVVSSLQTLTYFVASRGSRCSSLGELKGLNIGGSLLLGQLEHASEEDAKADILGKKNELRDLSLRWTTGTENEQHCRKVLEGLKAPDGLHALMIDSYQGTTFPTWMGVLQNIVELRLFDCKNSKQLPPLCQLPELQLLHLKGLEKLKCLCSIRTSSTFEKLEELVLVDLPNSDRWSEVDCVQGELIIFPRLQKLVIESCKNLTELAEAVVPRYTNGGKDNTMACLAFPELKEFKLKKLSSFQRWGEDLGIHEEQLITFPQLQKLVIEHCEKLMELTTVVRELEGAEDNTMARSAFPQLRELELKQLSSFQRWGEDLGIHAEHLITFPQLQKLVIESCENLMELPKAGVVRESDGGEDNIMARSAFPELRELKLERLGSFRRWEADPGIQAGQLIFPLLENVFIEECPELTTLPAAPKLRALEICKGNQQMFLWVARYMTSLSTLELKAQDGETTLPVEHTSVIKMVDGKEKWDHISPLTDVVLDGYYSLYSSAIESWTCFVPLQKLKISRCDVLLCWPEHVFQNLVLRRLDISRCNSLTGYAHARDQLTSGRSQLLPLLESLYINHCASLVEVFDLPASLKSMSISDCPALESIVFGKQEDRAALTQGPSGDAAAPTAVPNLSTSTRHHFRACLESLRIWNCDGLTEVLNLPLSLREISII
ncbi:hypothetical protein ACP70R_037602 [Stipagrostis hirtigluma subsp. patula]